MFQIKSILFTLIVFTYSSIVCGQNVQWHEAYPGIWKTSFGVTESISLLSAAEIKPAISSLEKLPKAKFPFNPEEISIKFIDGDIYLSFPLQEDEEIYGLGLNFQTHNQRGRILNLKVDHYGGKDNGRTHAPVPFYVSSLGYGVLFDVARYLTVYAGTGVSVDARTPPVLYDRNTDKKWSASPYSDRLEVRAPTMGLDIYIFGGPTPLKAVQRYNLMNGGGYIPPKWGLGFTQRVPTLYSDEDILNEVNDFETHDFPLEFIGVEPGWHSMAYPCTFEWDSTRFPKPKEFIDRLSAKGVRANLWMNPYVSPVGSLYPKVKPFSASHTVWNGLIPDFSMSEPRDLFRNHFMENHIGIGVSGYKIDEVDGFDGWLWPDVATFPSGHAAEQMRQTYGLMFQKMTADWYRSINKRTYGLVRASNAGASNLPYVIYNDYYSHKDFITALINSSFIGVLWTPEVRSSGSAEDWLRRMQSVCFSPMAMLNAWADGTKPWTFPEVEDQVREVSYLRTRLIPYIYSTFYRYYSEGIPPFRAMQLDEAVYNGNNQTSVSKVKYQYLMGESILVAPMFEGETERKVTLPTGKWYDFYTGEYVGENELITVSPGIEKIPLFVRDGAVIPMMPATRKIPEGAKDIPLELRHYGGSKGEFTLYDDDGLTFDYTKGNYTLTKFSIGANDTSGKVEKIKSNGFFSYGGEMKWVKMTKD